MIREFNRGRNYLRLSNFSFLAERTKTIPINVPTIPMNISKSMTGIRMAHSFGGKKFWIGLSSSTKG